MRISRQNLSRKFLDYFDLILIGSTHGMSDGFASFLVPVLALIVADLGISTFQVGVLLSVRSVSTFLFLFPLSLLADQSGRKKMMLIAGMAIAAVSYFSMLWAPSLGMVAVLAFCAGSGNSVYHPCGTALTAERFVTKRPYAISFHSMMGNLGASLIPLALVYIAGVGGWRLSVAVCTLPLVVLLPVIGLRFPAGNRGFLEDTRSDIWQRVAALIGLVLKNRKVVLLAAVYALRGMASKSMVGFLPLLASGQFGMQTPAIGAMLSLYFGMGVVAKPLMGFLYARLGARLALIIPLTLTGIFVLAIALTPFAPMLVVLVALIGATGPISPIILTAATDMSDKNALASSVGFIYTCHGLGFVSPLIGGWLAERYGMGINYIYSAVLIFGAAAVALLLRDPRRPSDRNRTGN